MTPAEWYREGQDERDEQDADPVCVCGVARSEHALCGCSDGFQSAQSWQAERRFIESLDDWEFDHLYGDN